MGFSIGDIAAGIYTALGVLSALHEREISGEGQTVDAAMVDCQIALLANAFARFFATGEVAQRIGTRHPVLAPFQAFPTQDGYLVLALAGEGWWRKFCQDINRQDLLTDERFKDNVSRTRNHQHLEAILSEITRLRTTADWVKVMEKIDVPCGPVNSIDQVAEDPHTLTREMIASVKHRKAGMLKVVNGPVKLSRTPVVLENASPDLGEPTDKVLTNLLGFSREEISRLKDEKAI